MKKKKKLINLEKQLYDLLDRINDELFKTLVTGMLNYSVDNRFSFE